MPSLKTTVRWILRAIALSFLLALLGLGYIYKIEPAWVEVKQVNLTLPRLAPAFHHYRLVQISDIHADAWMTENRLAQIVRRVNQQHPDLVALTGDFITREAVTYAPQLSALRQLTPKDRTVAVLGNHDHWSDAAVVTDALIKAGVTMLTNDSLTLQRGEALFHIAGVDDVWVGKARLDHVLQKLPISGAAVLLAHEPDFADASAATGRFDLQLSGHSHGGQVRLPFLGAPILPLHGKKYPLGQYVIKGMIQYTNRGVGTVKPRVRLNCRPEITVFTLEAAG